MTTIEEVTAAVGVVKEFMPRSELKSLAEGCWGEEQEFFRSKLVEMAGIISTMPKTYEQDGLGNQAVVYLHYFRGNQDWYITEKDVGTLDQPGQHQAFGLADLGDGGELGYISIVEVVAAGVELDLYFKPKTLAEIRAKRGGE